MAEKKMVYFFGGGQAEGHGKQKQVLGGKGAGLAEMTNIGLPVPPGFTITTESCNLYYKNDKRWPDGLKEQVVEQLKKLEKVTGKKLGNHQDPLLVSVRSGAAISMPGMMETILNLGLNDRSVKGLAERTNNPRFAYDAYRRLIMMYATTAMGMSKDIFEHAFDAFKRDVSAKRLHRSDNEKVADTEVSAEELQQLCENFKALYQRQTNESFPQDPEKQLIGSISAVFNSWMAEKAITYRRVEKIRDAELIGTGVNICTMVFGNKNETSGTGVAFTRDPNTGENTFYGDYLFNAQGEDVVAGIRTPVKLAELEKRNPEIYQELLGFRTTLEQHYQDMQDLEFTVEEGTLYILQTRRGKRTPSAAFKMAVDMVKEKLITEKEAVLRVTPEDIERLFYPEIDPSIPVEQLSREKLARGINAVPGAAAGKIYFTAAEAEQAAANEERIILVRKETSPEDVGGMHAARGILTQTGGKTSHAAVVARGWGKCCIVGCEALVIDYEQKTLRIGEKVFDQGDYLTLNGSTGDIYVGDLPLVDPTLPPEYYQLMKWVSKYQSIPVRTNADTPEDAEKAVQMGAEGIGLCRTEHMFFSTEERRDAIQEMIVSSTLEDRTKSLKKLLPFQREDFVGIFKAMNGYPVTIRLIDPPLHEFLPHTEEGQINLADRVGDSIENIKARVQQLHEFNPMLGHRGCRLAITYPEILEMQVQAIMEAACQCFQQKIAVHPEIMIPLVMDAQELRILSNQVSKIAQEILQKYDLSKKDVPYLIGTMIEIPRAALTADKIAEFAEFFSFGTNDLTQTTMGLSRDDAGRFLPDYVDETKAGIFKDDPFQVLDQEGVGQLVKIGIEKGRSTRPGLKIGICGEHGGDPDSVRFCVQLGMNYVSCSPYRVPIARLAIAQEKISSS